MKKKTKKVSQNDTGVNADQLGINVPEFNPDINMRDAVIMSLSEEGVSSVEISKMVGLSERRVRGISHDCRENGAVNGSEHITKTIKSILKHRRLKTAGSISDFAQKVLAALQDYSVEQLQENTTPKDLVAMLGKLITAEAELVPEDTAEGLSDLIRNADLLTHADFQEGIEKALKGKTINPAPDVTDTKNDSIDSFVVDNDSDNGKSQ